MSSVITILLALVATSRPNPVSPELTICFSGELQFAAIDGRWFIFFKVYWVLFCSEMFMLQDR